MSVPIKFDPASLYRCARRVSSATVFKGVRFKFKQAKFEAGNQATNKVPQSWSGWPPSLPRSGWFCCKCGGKINPLPTCPSLKRFHTF